jgi:hypothetical protein
MSTVPRVVIDPHLLCLRSACGSKDAFEAFAERLVSWSGVIGSPKIQILVSERCIGSLVQTGAYPFTHILRQAVKQFEVTHISADLLEKVAQWMMDLRPSYEDEADTDEVLFNDELTSIEPQHYLTRLDADCGSAFKHTLVSIALWRATAGKTFEVFLGSVQEANTTDREVKIASWSDGFARKNGDIVEFKPPTQLEEELICVFDCNEIVAASSALELWNSAKSEDDVRHAIEFRVREHQAIGLHPEKIDSWIIGKNFTESLHTWNFSQVASQAELVIDACARILLEKPRQPVKEFWSNVEKKIQIVRDDGATGWRTHLSKRGVGFRLMLWIHKNGTVEFANVANKAECEIY